MNTNPSFNDAVEALLSEKNIESVTFQKVSNHSANWMLMIKCVYYRLGERWEATRIFRFNCESTAELAIDSIIAEIRAVTGA